MRGLGTRLAAGFVSFVTGFLDRGLGQGLGQGLALGLGQGLALGLGQGLTLRARGATKLPTLALGLSLAVGLLS